MQYNIIISSTKNRVNTIARKSWKNFLPQKFSSKLILTFNLLTPTPYFFTYFF